MPHSGSRPLPTISSSFLLPQIKSLEARVALSGAAVKVKVVIHC
jgi:hypothetical protein